MNNYPLIYIRKNDSRIFHAKRIIPGVYKLRDPMLPHEAFEVTRYRLLKDYTFQETASYKSLRREGLQILYRNLA